MTLFYIPNPTQYLNLTTLLTIHKKQISSLLRQSCSLLMTLELSVTPYFFNMIILWIYHESWHSALQLCPCLETRTDSSECSSMHISRC